MTREQLIERLLSQEMLKADKKYRTLDITEWVKRVIAVEVNRQLEYGGSLAAEATE